MRKGKDPDPYLRLTDPDPKDPEADPEQWYLVSIYTEWVKYGGGSP